MTDSIIECQCGNDKKDCGWYRCKHYVKALHDTVTKLSNKRHTISKGVGIVVDKRGWKRVEKKGRIQPFQDGVFN